MLESSRENHAEIAHRMADGGRNPVSRIRFRNHARLHAYAVCAAIGRNGRGVDGSS